MRDAAAVSISAPPIERRTSVVRTWRALTGEERRLVELMRRIAFGRIERLCVINGSPTFEPMPRIVREVKLGHERTSGAIAPSVDFTLKQAVIELLAELQAIGDGVVALIEVRHGLPCRLVLEEAGDV
ncbi:MAG: hypothetical protein L0Y44_01300 [Phycisphaerales bacterium]|nr:hypothetical protein [Phycisphaerales bacterium]MCI0674943.1 hypothetical protein [Phycisphaerales bacterium]